MPGVCLPPAATAPKKLHYAWVVAGITFLILLVTAGVRATPSILIIPLEREFHWTRAAISGAIAVNIALFGIIGPFAASFMGRYGLRKIILFALALLAFAVALSSTMHYRWELMLFWGVLVGTGSGVTALVLAAVVVNRWFEERRGLVLGMLTAANATGQLVFLPFLAKLVTTHGWRSAVYFVAAIAAVVFFIVLFWMKDSPADVGLLAYGAIPQDSPAITPVARPPLGALVWAAKSREFWILAGSFFVCGASTNGLVQVHLIPMCLDFGIPQVQAASLLAAMGIFDFFGTIVSGWLSDRYDNRWLLFWYYGLRGLSLLFLPFSNFSFYGLSLFAMFYGLDWIATVPPTVRLTAQRFGPERANLVFGWIFAGHQLGAGVAAFGAGLSRTLLLSYLPAFFAAGALCIIAASLTLAISRPPKPVVPKPVAA